MVRAPGFSYAEYARHRQVLVHSPGMPTTTVPVTRQGTYLQIIEQRGQSKLGAANIVNVVAATFSIVCPLKSNPHASR